VAETQSTIAGLQPADDARLRRHRRPHAATTFVLTAIMALGVADAFGVVDVYGVESRRVSASGGGYDLEVQYGAISRPALATPFAITLTREGGFDGPITLAVDRDYLKLWDENGLVPAPSAESTRGGWVEWEFDPPDSDTLSVYYDARIEPAAQSGASGSVAVLDGGVAVVQVDFETRVLP